MEVISPDLLITYIRSMLEYNEIKFPLGEKDYTLVYYSADTERMVSPNHEDMAIHMGVDQETWDQLLILSEKGEAKGPMVVPLEYLEKYGVFQRDMFITDISFCGRVVRRLCIYKAWEYEYDKERSINGHRVQSLANMIELAKATA